MADDSELDYLRTFLGKVHTGATANSLSEKRNISQIADTQRMLIFPPEIMGSVGEDFVWKRYKVQVSEPTEAGMTTAINNVLIGIKKINKRTAITDFTRPSSLCHMKWANSTKAFEDPYTKRWGCSFMLDVEWSTI